MSNHSRPSVHKVPLDLIFSGPFPAASAQWSEVPLVNLEPHMSAVRAVLQGKGGFDSYWELIQSDADQGEPAGDRRAWEKEVARRIRRYARSWMPAHPTIGRYDRDRLILADGHLRCCVYKVQGKRWIRAKLLPDAASRWDARPTEPLSRAVARQNRKSFYTPVEHERFRTQRVSRKGSDRLDLIRGFLGPIRERRLSVLDVGCNIGYYSFHLARQGFEVVGVESDAQHFEVAESLRQMYGLDVELWQGPFESYAPARRFDVVLGLTVFWHFLPPKGSPDVGDPARALTKQLETLVGHALIWESGARGQEEIDLIRSNTGLKHFTLLGQTAGTGVHRQFGVFTRVPVNEAVSQLRGGGRDGGDGRRATLISPPAILEAGTAMQIPASRAG